MENKDEICGMIDEMIGKLTVMREKMTSTEEKVDKAGNLDELNKAVGLKEE
jgi:hypothetical protein